MESRGKISLEGMFPHGQELILLVPAGDLNPNRSLWVFQMDIPPPLVSPEIIPAREPLSNPLFPEGYFLVQRWKEQEPSN